MTARVLSVIACSTSRASMLPVSGSTSTNTGVAPACRIAFAVAMNVIGVVMTSSPGPISDAFSERNNALVQLDIATACSTPSWAANAVSNAAVRGPVVRNTPRSVSPAAAMSSSCSECR